MGGGGQGDNSGEDMNDGDSGDEDGKFDFHQSLIFPCVVVVVSVLLLPLLHLAFMYNSC